MIVYKSGQNLRTGNSEAGRALELYLNRDLLSRTATRNTEEAKETCVEDVINGRVSCDGVVNAGRKQLSILVNKAAEFQALNQRLFGLRVKEKVKDEWELSSAMWFGWCLCRGQVSKGSRGPPYKLQPKVLEPMASKSRGLLFILWNTFWICVGSELCEWAFPIKPGEKKPENLESR